MNVLAMLRGCPPPARPGADVRAAAGEARRALRRTRQGRTTRAASRGRRRGALREHRALLHESLSSEGLTWRRVLVESSLDAARAIRSDVVLAGEPWLGRIDRGQMLAHRRPGGQSGRRHAVLQRRGPARSIQRRGHDSRAGKSLPVDGLAAPLHRRRAPSHDRRGHLRPARHDRRRVLVREQHGAIRSPHEVDAQLSRQLPPGRGARGHPAVEARSARRTSTSS